MSRPPEKPKRKNNNARVAWTSGEDERLLQLIISNDLGHRHRRRTRAHREGSERTRLRPADRARPRAVSRKDQNDRIFVRRWPMTTVWIYVDTNKEVGDVDHLKECSRRQNLPMSGSRRGGCRAARLQTMAAILASRASCRRSI